MQVQALTGCEFNAVLLNLYRDGRDGMGWHADDEAELGPNPVIASVSLGAVRRFCLRHRRRKGLRLDLVAAARQPAPHVGRDAASTGCMPCRRPPTPVGERINLTFRRVLLR